MYKVFKRISKDKKIADYIILTNNIVRGGFESIYAYLADDDKSLCLNYDLISDISILTSNETYYLEYIYDRITDAIVHIKFELNLRDKLDKEDNQ